MGTITRPLQIHPHLSSRPCNVKPDALYVCSLQTPPTFIPKCIVSYWGPQFTSQVWSLKSLGLSSGYHPQSNGQMQRANQSLSMCSVVLPLDTLPPGEYSCPGLSMPTTHWSAEERASHPRWRPPLCLLPGPPRQTRNGATIYKWQMIIKLIEPNYHEISSNWLCWRCLAKTHRVYAAFPSHTNKVNYLIWRFKSNDDYVEKISKALSVN